MDIGDLILFCLKHSLSLRIEAGDTYIVFYREFKIGGKLWTVKKYISMFDFEKLEDCVPYLKEEFDREEERLTNEYNGI